MIIIAGLPRTGTTSLRKVFERLGCRVMSNPFMPKRVDGLLAGTWGIRDADKEGWDVVSDLPYYAWWLKFVEDMPATKVIWTRREYFPWRDSMQRFFWQMKEALYRGVSPLRRTKQQRYAIELMADPAAFVSDEDKLLDMHRRNEEEMFAALRTRAGNIWTLDLHASDETKKAVIADLIGETPDEWPHENRS